MKSGRTAPRTRLLRNLSLGALAVSALAALWQSYRVHRSVRETHPPDNVPLPTTPHVSIILPVRNEEANIDACLNSLLAQDYPDFDVTVIDDGSTDATPRLLNKWKTRSIVGAPARGALPDPHFQVLPNEPADPQGRSGSSVAGSHFQVHRVDNLPEGWAGKTHALHTGVTLTNGEWLLFTDADTCHAPQTLRRMLGHALLQRDDLLSMRTDLMTLIGPAMSLLMPMSEVLLALRVTPAEASDPAFPLAFAFGQYMLLRREAYLATGGYAAASMRTTSIDDLALAEHFKWHGQRLEVVSGRGLVTNRQWTTWKSAVRGWRKGCYGEIVRSNLPLAGLPAGLALLAFGLGPLFVLLYALCTGKVRRFSILFACIALLAQIDAKRCFDREYDLAFHWSLAAPAGWVISGILLLDVARRILTGRGDDWKGRHLPKQEVYSLYESYQSPLHLSPRRAGIWPGWAFDRPATS